MTRVNNISLIKSFLSSSENHLIINQVNEDIGLFYIYVTQFFALSQRLGVYISEEMNHKSSSDLFGEIKIPIIKTTSINKIDDATVTLNYFEDNPFKLYYNVQKSGYISTSDTIDVFNPSEIKYKDSVYNDNFGIFKA